MESNIKKNIKDIQKLKNAPSPFVAITAYDFPTAQIINDLEIPITLVGDSASMVVYGYKDTTSIDMEEMLLITKAVARGLHTSLLVGDMPFMSYQPSIELAIKNASRFIKLASRNRDTIYAIAERLKDLATEKSKEKPRGKDES